MKFVHPILYAFTKDRDNRILCLCDDLLQDRFFFQTESAQNMIRNSDSMFGTAYADTNTYKIILSKGINQRS
jgi:hypothetical protein